MERFVTFTYISCGLVKRVFLPLNRVELSVVAGNNPPTNGEKPHCRIFVSPVNGSFATYIIHVDASYKTVETLLMDSYIVFNNNGFGLPVESNVLDLDDIIVKARKIDAAEFKNSKETKHVDKDTKPIRNLEWGDDFENFIKSIDKAKEPDSAEDLKNQFTQLENLLNSDLFKSDTNLTVTYKDEEIEQLYKENPEGTVLENV